MRGLRKSSGNRRAEGGQICPTGMRIAFLCAGVTRLAACEAEPDKTRHVNVTQTVKLAESLASQGMYIVYLSSHAVFSGTVPFVESTSITKPQSEYGRQSFN